MKNDFYTKSEIKELIATAKTDNQVRYLALCINEAADKGNVKITFMESSFPLEAHVHVLNKGYKLFSEEPCKVTISWDAEDLHPDFSEEDSYSSLRSARENNHIATEAVQRIVLDLKNSISKQIKEDPSRKTLFLGFIPSTVKAEILSKGHTLEYHLESRDNCEKEGWYLILDK